MSKTAVVKKETTVANIRPAFLGNTARGSEEVGIDQLVLPRLELIQDISPQRKKNDPEYIEGAEEGMVYNTVTGELIQTPFQIVPVYFRTEWLLWQDRKKGGGFFGSFPTEVAANRERMQMTDVDPNDLEATETHVHFILRVLEDGSGEECVMSMNRSKLKTSRTLNSMVKLGGGDRFSHMYNVGSFTDTNRKGEQFWMYRISPAGWVTEQLFRQAEKVYDSIVAGQMSVNHSGVESETEDGTEF